MENDPQSANTSSSPSSHASFGAEFDNQATGEREAPWGRDASGAPEEDWFQTAQQQATFGWSMARLWVKQNPSTAMLGAVALGAFVGAMLRD